MAPSFRSPRAAAAAPAVASSRRARILLPLLHTAVALLAFGTVASSLAVAVALKLGLTGVPPAWPAPRSAFSWDNPNTAERLTLFLDEPFPQQPALAAARAALTARLATALVACTTVGLGWGLASRLARCALARSPPATQTAASLRTTGAVAAVVSLGVARFAVGVARARRRDGATYEQPGYAFEPAGDTDVAVAAAGCLAAFSLSMLLWSVMKVALLGSWGEDEPLRASSPSSCALCLDASSAKNAESEESEEEEEEEEDVEGGELHAADDEHDLSAPLLAPPRKPCCSAAVDTAAGSGARKQPSRPLLLAGAALVAFTAVVSSSATFVFLASHSECAPTTSALVAPRASSSVPLPSHNHHPSILSASLFPSIGDTSTASPSEPGAPFAAWLSRGGGARPLAATAASVVSSSVPQPSRDGSARPRLLPAAAAGVAAPLLDWATTAVALAVLCDDASRVRGGGSGEARASHRAAGLRSAAVAGGALAVIAILYGAAMPGGLAAATAAATAASCVGLAAWNCARVAEALGEESGTESDDDDDVEEEEEEEVEVEEKGDAKKGVKCLAAAA